MGKRRGLNRFFSISTSFSSDTHLFGRKFIVYTVYTFETVLLGSTMSNKEAVCADLYERIIEDVIQESRQDFEDSGIDEQTLQDLKKLWKEKLSSAGVAKFSWDVVKEEQQQQQMNASMSYMTTTQPELYNGTANDATPISEQLHVPQSDLSIPAIKQEDTGIVLPGGTTIGQADGAALNTQEPVEFEVTMDHLALEKLKRRIKRKQRKQLLSESSSNNKHIISQADGPFDDDDDDDEDDNGSDLGDIDSDEINSDLDDSEDDDNGSDDDNDDADVNIMLCLYDRVQRVKNKWKCNLKDGIANISGKDYVFQKANGESEW